MRHKNETPSFVVLSIFWFVASRDCRRDDSQLTEVLNSACDDRRISNFIAMTGQVTAGRVLESLIAILT
jgi:hypothetical protein